MKKWILAAVAVASLAAEAGAWGEPNHPFAHTAVPIPTTGAVFEAARRPQPVVGSVRRTGRFANPFTHRAKYEKTVYLPLQGTFGKMQFKQ